MEIGQLNYVSNAVVGPEPISTDNDDESFVPARVGPLKVVAYTGGRWVPGARFRVRQYVPHLSRLGIDLLEVPAKYCCYPPRSKWLRPTWAASLLGSRIGDILRGRDADLVLLQREMLSTFYSLERFTRRPRILDVDDAIWLHRDGSFARRLAQASDAVICGNPFLADWFGQWCNNIFVLPTAVDTDRYKPSQNHYSGALIIGWSGTSSGHGYLNHIAPAIAAVLERHPEARLRIVSESCPCLTGIPRSKIEYIPWSEEVEVEALQTMTIGLMPLDDSAWSRGKCAYKMLLYMSCGVPVVVTPVGMNLEVLARGEVGFGACTNSEWTDALLHIICHNTERHRIGCQARHVVLEHYSLRKLVPQLADYLTSIASGT